MLIHNDCVKNALRSLLTRRCVPDGYDKVGVCDIKRIVLFILLKFRKKLLYKNIWLAVPAKDVSLEDKSSEGIRCPLYIVKGG